MKVQRAKGEISNTLKMNPPAGILNRFKYRNNTLQLYKKAKRYLPGICLVLIFKSAKCTVCISHQASNFI